jgi:acyl dehydratase
MTTFSDDDFLVVRPGQLTERERPLVEAYLAENAAILARGPVDAEALASGRLDGAPGVGPRLPVTREMVDYVNAKYDPDNRLLSDVDVAARHGFPDVQPFGTFGAHDDTFMVPYPFPARDTLCVSQLNHEVSILRPIHPGDTLRLVADRRTVRDRTPIEGSTYRHVEIASAGSVYNQRGEKVNDVVFRVMESVRQLRRGPVELTFQEAWDAPPWTDRPAHVYTETDWRRITDIWRHEQPRGEDPLHWEDVSTGRSRRSTDRSTRRSCPPTPSAWAPAGRARSSARSSTRPCSRR